MGANRPVPDGELAQYPGRISRHVARVRDLLEQKINDPNA